MKKISVLLFAVVALFTGVAFADEPAYDQKLANEPKIAYSKDYDINLRENKIDLVTFQVEYDTPTAPSAFTATDGSKSTGMITIVSTTGCSGVSLDIGQYRLIEGRHWNRVATTTGTASALATAINAYYPLKNYITATWTITSSTITLQADYIGTTYNYSCNSSSQAALTISTSTSMTGGKNSDISYTADTIYEADHGLTTGMQVLYSISGSTSPSGLTKGTTYFALPYTLDEFRLSTTSTGAIAGVYVNIVSTTNPGGGTMTFTPRTSAGTKGGVVWQVSNDGVTFADLTTVSSVTISGAGSGIYDFSEINYKYLRAHFVAAANTLYELIMQVYGKTRK